MNYLNPIYTEPRECQDCYKCLRSCPVKSIKVENGFASVIPELCILCGDCVAACPNGAKRVRDDLPRARQVLQQRPRVIASLAPSWPAEFPHLRPGQMIAALKRLGFSGVSETALGAEQVSAHVAALMREHPDRAYLSSACPTAVAFLQKYRPELGALITELLSPALAHARLLQGEYGQDVGVIFIGPCIAKKAEAAAHPELLDVALTFEELRRWMRQDRVDPGAFTETEEDRFVPSAAREGALYPVDGGMNAGVKADCTTRDAALMCFSGLRNIDRALQGLDRLQPTDGLFIELLACEGGCISGPQTSRDEGTAVKRYRLLKQARYPAEEIPRAVTVNACAPLPAARVRPPAHLEMEIREVLRGVGKLTMEDELNCGGCGYETCREFARAFLDGKAERSMCVTHMRKMAHKKANALIRKMPSAVVIVDDRLRVIECNDNFARLFAPKGAAPDQVQLALDGASLARLVPFPNLFNGVLKTGEDLLDRDLRYRDTVLHASIFSIEKHCVVGGIFQDITRPAVQKQQVIQKAREVIQKNLATVQQIAFLLGENAAESELTLDSIIESFSTPDIEEPTPDATDWKRKYRR